MTAKEKKAAYAREWRRKNREHVRARDRKRRSGEGATRRSEQRRRLYALTDPDVLRERRRSYLERNRDKINAQVRQRYAARPGLKQAYHRRSMYGLGPEEFGRLKASQDDRCAICRTEFRPGRNGLHIDHDHFTGEVRGLLCGHCNAMLGHARESLTVLDAARDYLASHLRARLNVA